MAVVGQVCPMGRLDDSKEEYRLLTVLLYLLYGQHPILLFDIIDLTFHTLDWLKVRDTVSLLALRMEQLEQRNDLLRDAHEKSFHS